MSKPKVFTGVDNFTDDHSDGSERLQVDQDYCLICDDVLVKCEEMEEGDHELFLEERSQSCGGDLLTTKFCKLFGVIGPVKRWVAAKILEEEEEKSLFCEGCDAQVKMLIELKRRVEELEEKLEGGKNEIRWLVGMAERRSGGDEVRRNKEIRRIRQQILRGHRGSGLPCRTSLKRIIARKCLVLISQAERKLAEERQALDAIKVDAPEDTPMDVSDFKCSSDSGESLYAPASPRRRRRERCRSSKTNTVPFELGVNVADIDADKVDQDLNSNDKKRNRPSGLNLKDGIYTYDGTTLRICHDDNGKLSLFKCDTCGDLVPRANLRHHVLSKHIIKQCKLCGKVCSLATLTRHLMFVHGRKLKTVTCSICGRPGIPLNHSKRHKWTHLNSEERLEFLAKVGDKVPSYAKIWNRSVCDICGVTLRGERLLKHMQTVHATQEDRKAAMRICPICGRAVVNLEKHMKTVHSEGKYPCPYCENKIFKSKHLLNVHIRNSHRNKSFHCTICDRAFMRQNILEGHMNCHLGIRPFSCNHCEMTLTAKLHLQKHTRIYHTEGREPSRRKSFIRGPDRKKKVVDG